MVIVQEEEQLWYLQLRHDCCVIYLVNEYLEVCSNVNDIFRCEAARDRRHDFRQPRSKKISLNVVRVDFRSAELVHQLKLSPFRPKIRGHIR